MATTPNYSQPAIFSEVSTPAAPDAGYLKVYGKAGVLCSIANGGSEKTYAASTDLSSYLPLAGGTLTGDLKFTDATYDIGKSGATRPRDGWFSRDITAGSDVKVGSTGYLRWGTTAVLSYNGTNLNFDNTPLDAVGTITFSSSLDVKLVREGFCELGIRNSTDPFTFNIYGTYTSGTAFERLTFKPTTTDTKIGIAVGSAGGTATRSIKLGHWDSTGTWVDRLTFTASQMQFIADTTPVMAYYGYGNNSTGPIQRFYKSRATDRNSTGVYPTGGDVLTGMYCYGWDENATDWSAAKARYTITASGTWTSTANGTQHTWATTDAADTGKVITDRMRLSSEGYLGIGTTSPTGLLDVNSTKIRIRTSNTPANASASGNAGEICWDASYIYVCTATNTWKRVAIATWV
jgi:hypothetical protein